MKLVKEKGTVETSGDFKEIEFGVKEQDMGIILEILRSKMYSNPVGAISREIASNARDANREAGNEKTPIQITIQDSPFLGSDLSIIFKDSGPGISPERIADVFVNYGSSTKRDSNKETGGFGLGAKTPFSYADNFSIITVFNKRQYIYTAAIEGQSRGKLYKVSDEPTDEENGTSIVIPIQERDRSAFENEMYRATFFWKVRPIYKGFKQELPKIKKLYHKDGIQIHTKAQDYTCPVKGKWYLLIDEIVYDIDDDQSGLGWAYRSNGANVFLEFKTGQLAIAANREAVQYDETTKKRILRKRAELLKAFSENLTNWFDSAPTYVEACIRYSSAESKSDAENYHQVMRSTLESENNSTDFKYKGKIIRRNIPFKTNVILVRTFDGKMEKVIKTKWSQAFLNSPLVLQNMACLSSGRNATLFAQNQEGFLLFKPEAQELTKWSELSFTDKRKYARRMRDYVNDLQILKDNKLSLKEYSTIEITKVPRKKGEPGTYNTGPITIFAKKLGRIHHRWRHCDSWVSSPFTKRESGVITHNGEPLDKEKQCYCTLEAISLEKHLRREDRELAKAIKGIFEVTTYFVNPKGEKHLKDKLLTLDQWKKKIPQDKINKIALKQEVKKLTTVDRFWTQFTYTGEIQKGMALLEKYLAEIEDVGDENYSQKFLDLAIVPDLSFLKTLSEGFSKKYPLLFDISSYERKNKIPAIIQYISLINTIPEEEK